MTPRGGGGAPAAAGWAERGLAWWSTRGSASQALVPGGYAWAVTIAPVGAARGAGLVAGLATTVGLVALVLGPAIERRAPAASRMLVGWGLVVSAIVTWSFAPDGVVDMFDAARGIAGMFGWALFAFAIASPARQTAALIATPSTLDAEPVRTRHVDRAVLLLAVGLTVALEVPGWRTEQRDRALLLRLVALAGGLGLVTTASAILARYHAPLADERPAAAPRRRLRATDAAWVATACVLVGAGATYELWHP